ncbi:hypothetical protein BCR43DRAFT_497238 [Syncephalastrum racemosum]|uniref:GATA-type domain-containing protein n=1 Tax=Syncephalastrum racemosum TaxID=13706 RepID=A0A1X2H5D2_SYNRA|nr:hypothetical protein BCR43DRAFT_497238 [Syncephalastrum racemosum]
MQSPSTETHRTACSARPILPPISSIDPAAQHAPHARPPRTSFDAHHPPFPGMSLPSPPTLSTKPDERLSPHQLHQQLLPPIAQQQRSPPNTSPVPHHHPYDTYPPQQQQQQPVWSSSWQNKTTPSPPLLPQHGRQIHPRQGHLQASVRKSILQDIDQIVNNCSGMRDTMVDQQHHVSLAPDDAMLFLLWQNQQQKQPWLDDMITRANEVLNALLRLQKHQLAAQEEHRRAYYYGTANSSIASFYNKRYHDGPMDEDEAEDNDDTMSSLRRLRQRKRRKRTVFQGRCHSCNISETPEWRRGPDGARTLCNACGLHYAKLERKRAAEKKQQEHDKDKQDEPDFSASTATPLTDNDNYNDNYDDDNYHDRPSDASLSPSSSPVTSSSPSMPTATTNTFTKDDNRTST